MISIRVAPQITLNDKERKILQQWSRGRSTPARLVLRAKIGGCKGTSLTIGVTAMIG
jgi:DNA-binding CsgD family transcriptional regulator